MSIQFLFMKQIIIPSCPAASVLHDVYFSRLSYASKGVLLTTEADNLLVCQDWYCSLVLLHSSIPFLLLLFFLFFLLLFLFLFLVLLLLLDSNPQLYYYLLSSMNSVKNRPKSCSRGDSSILVPLKFPWWNESRGSFTFLL